MKKSTVYIACALLAALLAMPLSASGKKAKAPSAQEIAGRSVTSRYFTGEAVPEADIEKILYAGINTESASNKQLWHFSAVTSKTVLKEILDTVNAWRVQNGRKALPQPAAGKAVETNIADIPLLIIVSCDRGTELNAGLATQSMAIMAGLLGYGTKVESSPAAAINESAELSKKLGIPEGKSAVTVIKIGKVDKKITPDMDGYSGASVRNPFDQMATRIK